MKRTSWILASLVVVLAAIGQARADIVAATLDNTTGPGLFNPPFTLGWTFTVNSAITVTNLGVFDDSQDGLTDSYSVGIWDGAGNLLTSTTVASGTTDPLINQFRYASTTAVTLLPGTYNIGAFYGTGDDGLIFPGSASNFATAPEISFVQDAYSSNGSLSDPTNSDSTSAAYFGPNFTFTPANAVPEPSGLALLGMAGATFAGYFGWRRRKLAVA